jgi:NitT/TauT family transport system permease protein
MSYQIPQMYAAILTTTVVGLVVNYVLVGLERRFSRWRA